jgi:hypothetical protein
MPDSHHENAPQKLPLPLGDFLQHRPGTNGYALDIITASGNDTAIGRMRLKLRESNDPRFAAIDQIERHFLYDSLDPEAAMTAEAKRLLNMYRQILGVQTNWMRSASATIGNGISRVRGAMQPLLSLLKSRNGSAAVDRRDLFFDED